MVLDFDKAKNYSNGGEHSSLSAPKVKNTIPRRIVIR